ncbi:MAG: hypothetical protein EON85_09185 [Brevundimonas sp.]|nr:MAG: hypothetical protein EON85_09185 [Brevundimonas sp.]
MRSFLAALALALTLAAAPVTAEACALPLPFNPEWIRDADAVVAGRVTLHSSNVRQYRASRTGNPGQGFGPSPTTYFWIERETVTVDVEVDQVLMGEAPQRLRLDWPGQFVPGETAFEPGHYVIALERGPSMRPDDDRIAIYDSMCRGGPLYARSGSARGMAFLRVLSGRAPDAPPLPERADDTGISYRGDGVSPYPEPVWRSPRFRAPEGLRRAPVLPLVLTGGALGGVIVAAIALRLRRKRETRRTDAA